MEETLGKRICSNRKRLGMTQDQLAEKLGVTAQAVSKWENDLSCPDISILPQLAQIFSISTDTLLGLSSNTPIASSAQIAEENDPATTNRYSGNWEFTLDRGRKGAIPFAVFVIAVGVLYLLSKLLYWDISLWNIIWPTSLLVFGLFGILNRFNFFCVGCLLTGGYFLANKLGILKLSPDGGTVFAIVIVLFGISLLIDAISKPKKKHIHFNNERGQVNTEYTITEDSFDLSACFGENHQLITMPLLRRGKICNSFGAFHIDLSGVASLSEDCYIQAENSFGELVLIVPSKFQVKPASSTAFGAFTVYGQSESDPEGNIQLDAETSFGEIRVQYI